ncbi:calpain-8 [Echria macrotheca]|uniref:Calpain-8 n=1 Tax=Echria macrotheca TaxID=438768 RepID=A0AAJ0F5M1_9PEZI|nr:calpain-8 [Echria macrotheca]
MPVYIPPGGFSRDHHRSSQKAPQKKMDEFWARFTTKAPGKATTLLPKNEYAEALARRRAAKLQKSSTPTESTGTASAQASFDEAAAKCRAKVDKIIAECRRVNQKYRDPHFDLEFDLKTGRRDCLESLDNLRESFYDDSSDDESVVSRRPPHPHPHPHPHPIPHPGPPRLPSPGGRQRHRRQRRSADYVYGNEYGVPGGDSILAGLGMAGEEEGAPGRPQNRTPGSRFAPKSVKRVGEIFDDPKFYIDGPSAHDVRQGRDGDCWLMAALCTLSNKPGLIERICVRHDQAVGVYGFVFYRDGEWFSEIIDDKLYLTKPDYDEAMSDRLNIERLLWDDGRERVDSEEIYRKTYQSNSGALYFAQCENPNETWLPLLEKAYAKAHGDYAAIEGGFTGEGIEDLTGGVTSELFTTDILDKEDFWKNELMQVNKEFLFGCSTGLWGRGWGERKGIVEQHAYSVMRAVEMDGERLLLLKNPWGKTEWKGAWSDGSREWTPEWLQKLQHRFGDDGAFWISYKDLLRKYQNFDRTRLFGPDWKIASIWTTLSVPWTIEYHDTKFAFTLAKPGPVVIVLSQLDDRYFRGLEGQYTFSLSFRIHRAGANMDDYLVRTRASYRMKRSVSVELDLEEAGEYLVLVKIDAERYDDCLAPEDVVRRNAKRRREKLLRIGLAYDLAHSKAKIIETPEEKAAREAYEKKKREKYRERLRKAIMKDKQRTYYQQTKNLKTQRRMLQRQKEKRRAKAEKREEERRLREEDMKKKEEERNQRAAGKRVGVVKKDGKETVKSDQEDTAKEGFEKTGEKAGGEKTDAKDAPKEDVGDKTGDDKAKPDTEAKAVVPDDKVEDASTAGENTPPTSNSGILPSEPAEPPEAKLESQSSFHTSLETIEPENPDGKATDKKAEADQPKDKPQEKVQLPPKIERELREMMDIAEAFNHSKARLESLLGRRPHKKNQQQRHIGRPGHHTATSSSSSSSSSSGSESEIEIIDGHPPSPRIRHPHSSSHHLPPPPAPRQNHQQHTPMRMPPPSSSGPPRFNSSSGGPRPPGGYPGPPPPPPGSQYNRNNNNSFHSDNYDSDGLQSIMTPSDVSETELDYRLDEEMYRPMDRPGGGNTRNGPPGPMPPMIHARGGNHHNLEDEFERDPWNAVVVVGLRVYYKVSEEDQDKEIVRLRVIRPNPYEMEVDEEEKAEIKKEEEEEEEKKKEGEDEEKKDGDDEGENVVLDLDDSAKDATVV